MTNPIDTNLKTAAAIGKPTLSDVPPIGFFALGAAMKNGADKYGRYNWRDTEVTSSVFFDATMRHMLGWWNGEDYASDSKVHHLGHAMASPAIILDAQAYGVLNDDRTNHRKVDIDAIMKIIMATEEPEPKLYTVQIVDTDGEKTIVKHPIAVSLPNTFENCELEIHARSLTYKDSGVTYTIIPYESK